MAQVFHVQDGVAGDLDPRRLTGRPRGDRGAWIGIGIVDVDEELIEPSHVLSGNAQPDSLRLPGRRPRQRGEEVSVDLRVQPRRERAARDPF